MNYDMIFVGEDWKVPPKYYPFVFVLTLVALIHYPFLCLRNRKLKGK